MKLLYTRKKERLRWKILWLRVGFWLIAEIWLNLIGIDDFADYSEFIFEGHLVLIPQVVNSNHKPAVYCAKINDFCPIKSFETLQQTPQIEVFYSREIFLNKCIKVKFFCLKAELISQII